MYDWDDDNLEHIARHGVEPWEAEEATQDPRRTSFPAHDVRAGVVGRTEEGRVLVVILERGVNPRRIVTARDASRNEKRAYRKRSR